ncbi:hypothetical protein SAMN04488082_10212 [Desulfomicrobium apsheronum]|uniref:Lipoprotein n=1 Tax=Desulfomicrobium apsheronum TaxID=52560 RepID=A0A1I3PJ46_9BACT|nr:hypothetical protein [Desulfomicrobium apsheronum]SFJ21339.1 hypothetical protein SAMN04488082_10212 [Desulfomicrobium apsheronum]
MKHILILFALSFLVSCADSKIQDVQDLKVGNSDQTLIEVVNDYGYIKDSKWEIVEEKYGNTVVKFSANYDVNKCVEDMMSLAHAGFPANIKATEGVMPSLSYIVFTGIVQIFQGFDDYGDISKILKEDQRMHSLEVIVEFVIPKDGAPRISNQYSNVNGEKVQSLVDEYFPEMLNGFIPASIVTLGEQIKKEHIRKIYDEKERIKKENYILESNSLFQKFKSNFSGEWINFKKYNRDWLETKSFIFEFDVFIFSNGNNNSMVLNLYEYKVQSDRFLLFLLECEKRELDVKLRKVDKVYENYSQDVRDQKVEKLNAEINALVERINIVSLTPYRVVDVRHAIHDLVLNFNAVLPISSRLDSYKYVYSSNLVSDFNNLMFNFGVNDGVNDSKVLVTIGQSKDEKSFYLYRKVIDSDISKNFEECKPIFEEHKVFFQDIIQNFDYSK